MQKFSCFLGERSFEGVLLSVLFSVTIGVASDLDFTVYTKVHPNSESESGVPFVVFLVVPIGVI